MMVSVTELTPTTGFIEPPTPDLFVKLQAIVENAEPSLRGLVRPDEFRRAFIALGYMYRTPAPRSDVYFVSHVERVNAILDRWSAAAVDSNAVLMGLIAHNDVPWRRRDPTRGQMLEAGLDAHSGRRCSNLWQGVLRGEPLLKPVESAHPVQPMRIVRSASEM